MPAVFNVALLPRAHEEGVVYGSKAVGEPPLMLAFSVREALREAAAAFGPTGVSVDLASPATPEAVYWALEAARGASRTTRRAVHEGATARAAAERRRDGTPSPRSRRRADVEHAGSTRARCDVQWTEAVGRCASSADRECS